MALARTKPPDTYKYTLDLRRAVTDSPPSGRHAVFIPCLYHDDGERANLAVYADGVNCFACGRNKPPLQFIADLNKLDLTADHAKVQALADEIMQAGPAQAKQERRDPPETLAKNVLAWFDSLRASFPCMGYTEARGLTKDTVVAAKLGYTGRAYSIPLYDRDGALFSVKYRRDDSQADNGATPKYWNHPGTPNRLYYPPLLDWAKFDGKPVVVVEGELDALVLAQAGVPAVTCPTGVNGLQAATAEAVQRHGGLVLCLDNDEPGQFATTRLLNDAVTQGKAAAVAWRDEWGKDASEAFAGGYGEALKAALRRAYSSVAKGA